jgi:hypothetical protein
MIHRAMMTPGPINSQNLSPAATRRDGAGCGGLTGRAAAELRAPCLHKTPNSTRR